MILLWRAKRITRRGGIESESSLYIHVGTQDSDQGRLRPRSLWNWTERRAARGLQITEWLMSDGWHIWCQPTTDLSDIRLSRQCMSADDKMSADATSCWLMSFMPLRYISPLMCVNSSNSELVVSRQNCSRESSSKRPRQRSLHQKMKRLRWGADMA
jgi:hypothetical protein